jgi:hypothetical protein
MLVVGSFSFGFRLTIQPLDHLNVVCSAFCFEHWRLDIVCGVYLMWNRVFLLSLYL